MTERRGRKKGQTNAQSFPSKLYTLKPGESMVLFSSTDYTQLQRTFESHRGRGRVPADVTYKKVLVVTPLGDELTVGVMFTREGDNMRVLINDAN